MLQLLQVYVYTIAIYISNRNHPRPRALGDFKLVYSTVLYFYYVKFQGANAIKRDLKFI